ncbi:MAG TPA: folate-binding protein [Candidatus Angelobacter sp.]|nr:folate-binding protein [Candidatus Angelobacter sp.]
MSQTVLYPRPAVGEALVGSYNGAQTVLSFGSPAAELAALRSGCGVFALPWRAQISATGKDRVRWLHNMVTNNVRDLGMNHGNYNFVLNAQGRILGDLYIFNRGESLLLETDSSQVETLVNSLKRYIIMDKVELAPSGANLACLGVCGPKAGQVLSAAGINVSGMGPLEVREINREGLSAILIAGPAKKPNWFEIWADSAQAQDFWNRLSAAGAQPVGAHALEMWRVLRGIPNYGQDIRDRDLPQETGQTDALNFTKGCYIGQEIVERIRSRGQVHRQFVGFEFPATAPALGKHESEGRVLAEITSLAHMPVAAGERNIGLGYVRREALSAGAEIDLNGVGATIVELPFNFEEN